MKRRVQVAGRAWCAPQAAASPDGWTRSHRQKRGSAPSFVECNVLRSQCGEHILDIHGAPWPQSQTSDESHTWSGPDKMCVVIKHMRTWHIYYYVVSLQANPPGIWRTRLINFCLKVNIVWIISNNMVICGTPPLTIIRGYFMRVGQQLLECRRGLP